MPINVDQLNFSSVKTVSDLKTYLATFSSPIAAQFIQDAISFFLAPLDLEDRKERRRAIKQRKQMGMNRKLEETDELTAEVCTALSNHIVHPSYGRRAASHTAYLAAASFGDSNPILTACAVLKKITEQ